MYTKYKYNMESQSVYQWHFEYFFGSNSGYGTVRSKYGNIFSNTDICYKNLEEVMKSYQVKKWSILEYELDNLSEPTVVLYKPDKIDR